MRPPAVKLAVLDDPRGVRGADTDMGMAVSGLADDISEEKLKAGEATLSDFARRIARTPVPVLPATVRALRPLRSGRRLQIHVQPEDRCDRDIAMALTLAARAPWHDAMRRAPD